MGGTVFLVENLLKAVVFALVFGITYAWLSHIFAHAHAEEGRNYRRSQRVKRGQRDGERVASGEDGIERKKSTR